MTRRGVWTLAELLALLRGVASMGGDVRTLTAIAQALGILQGVNNGNVSTIGGNARHGTGSAK